MRNSTTVLGNLLSHLDRSDFENTVSEFKGDFKTRTLSTFTVLKTLIYGQVTSSFSVREIESSLAANSSKLYHCGLSPVKRSTLCDALKNRDYRIFENTFASLVDKAKIIAGNNGRRFKNPLKIIDASTIDLCLARFDWAKFRKTKGAVKLHLKLDGDFLFPEQAVITTGAVHEVNQMPKLCQKPGEIYVFDRGYIDYKRLYDIEIARSFFVTRMKSNSQYEIVECRSKNKKDSIRLDASIKLPSKNRFKDYPKTLRMVCFHDEKYNRDYTFLTNNFDLSAQEIADIYKSRWQVELFFKWLKQNLKIKTFWGTSKNAVFIQIWTALIVSVLLWIHKALSNLEVSTQRILQVLKTTILTKNSIIGLFSPGDPPPKVASSQLIFEGFKF